MSRDLLDGGLEVARAGTSAQARAGDAAAVTTFASTPGAISTPPRTGGQPLEPG